MKSKLSVVYLGTQNASHA